ncbi:MAG: hypothetical protein KTR32_42070 [Granulosicoccus sp.]|nr:hypothetical protein [Granulosicoccus sp.]
MINRTCIKISLTALCILLASCKVEPTSSFSGQLEPFYGKYTGTSEPTVSDGEIAERDLSVTIAPWDKKGFTVTWTTVIYKADGETKKSSPTINFYPSSRPGIFASAMKTDVFGHTVPYDPIAKDANPYVWAGLEDNTLTVSALYIIDGGGYEIQVYKRSLENSGLSLDFERIKDGEQVTRLSAQLEPVSD